eukprot:TRINITY_DN3925_c0_g1_i1.p1 TRINITY_DN3925_c0_g1~~TRINITY_DN3925_c0_g1_i1.p1  ORF type:complete len:307 (+),score=34.87 TRINITY_DN3925_c0_g1_i1:378-1298(+)
MWIDFQGFSSEDMKPVEAFFNIHPLTTEDCFTTDTREKFETFDDYYFIVANEIHYIEYSNILNNVNICMIVFPALDIVLSFHAEPIQSVHEVVHKLSFEPQGCIPSPDWLVYALLDGVVDIYVTLVDQLVREAESLDGLVLLLTGVEQTELLERIGYANRQSNHLKSGLWSKREILSALRTSGKVSSNVAVYMQNVVDHVLRCNQKLKLARETLGSLNSVYLAKVSIELATVSNEMNVVMRALGGISAIFLPLTFISGVFGMNVRVPGMIGFGDNDENYGWFIGIIVFMLALTIGIALFLRWKKWL